MNKVKVKWLDGVPMNDYSEVKRDKPQKEGGIFWAYFSPDGFIQMRSIAPTKAQAREFIRSREYDEVGNRITWKDYKKAGFVLAQINLKITPIANIKKHL